MSARFPTSQNRTAVVGTTGSGKTQFAVFLLSTRDYDKRPWIIFDWKGDDLIDEIGATDISVKDNPPKKPGLYRLRLVPDVDDAALEAFLWKIHAKGGYGLYLDEGYMAPKRSKALLAILTQGRSKHIEMITLVQRPRFLPTKFILTEAQFFAFFYLTNMEDKKYLKLYAEGYDPKIRLPKYHSTWYDADQQTSHTFGPVPNRDDLIALFDRKRGRAMRAL